VGIYGDLLKLNQDQQSPAAAPRVEPVQASTPKPKAKPRPKPVQELSRDTTISSNHDIKQPRNHDTTISRSHATMIESIRAAVKLFGKEAATHRFTAEEKKALADLVYTYKGLGMRTSENEIARISVNFIVADYQENGENSILHRVLRALNS
jgi:hypothetical protein